jgi:hypothetical protein
MYSSNCISVASPLVPVICELVFCSAVRYSKFRYDFEKSRHIESYRNFNITLYFFDMKLLRRFGENVLNIFHIISVSRLEVIKMAAMREISLNLQFV